MQPRQSERSNNRRTSTLDALGTTSVFVTAKVIALIIATIAIEKKRYLNSGQKKRINNNINFKQDNIPAIQWDKLQVH